MTADAAPPSDVVADTLLAMSEGRAVARIAGETLPPGLAHLAHGAFGAALAKAVDYAQRSVSPRTEKAYSDNWDIFRNWCAGHSVPYLPAPPAVVAAYLAERSATLGRSGLRLVIAAIAYHHRRAGLLWVSGDPVITTVLRGILRNQKRPVRPATALTSTELRKMLLEFEDDISGIRDRALLLIGFAGALRRSELVALDREDVRFTPDGLVLRIRSSKADQEGVGEDVGIARGLRRETCPVRALEAWLTRGKIEYGAVFRRLTAGGTVEGRLTGNGVWKILKRRAAAVELSVEDGERLSPHGLRAGFITEAYLHGALDEHVGHHARQKSLNTTRNYRRRAKTVAASPTKLLDL
jgi:integrase